MASRWARALAATMAWLMAPACAFAQAWPAPDGTGAVTVSTQVIDNTGHRMTDGYWLQDGKSRDVSAMVEFDYALTDRLSISVGLPYVFAKYIGPGPTPAEALGGGVTVDTCRCWHGAWQDVGATARFTVVDGRVALTPSVSIGAPTHNYEFEGEAVAGYGLTQIRLALDGGVRLDPISPRLAVQARYQYAVVEDVLDVPNNRSNWSTSASYLLSPRLSVRGGASWQRTHGGLRFGSITGVPFSPPGEASTPELFPQHDRLLRDNSWHLGAGTTYALPHVDVFVSYVQFMGGTDTHSGKALTVGTSWVFRTGR
ncbi:MAG: hypothetical protein JJE40_18155 [Vicinamibacteria bacterium]|nr:hypothetical protein [Vicinamibacteria bacterium]